MNNLVTVETKFQETAVTALFSVIKLIKKVISN